MKVFRWPLRRLPEIKAAGYFPMPAWISGRLYQHDTYALHQHLYDGRVTMGRVTYAFRSGDVTITPPGVVSSYELAEGGQHWCVHFSAGAAVGRGTRLELPLLIQPKGGEAVHIRERMAAVCDAFRPWSRRRGETELAGAAGAVLFQSLLLYLARQGGARRRVAPGRPRAQAGLDAVKAHLDGHFQRRIRLEELVALSGLSRNFFALRFRQRFGTTVGGYLLHLRLEMARNLLLSTGQAVKEIAFECGIPDPNYFNKQFRRLHGVSPSLYRARSRSKW